MSCSVALTMIEAFFTFPMICILLNAYNGLRNSLIHCIVLANGQEATAFGAYWRLEI